jgi:hypothetical protein
MVIFPSLRTAIFLPFPSRLQDNLMPEVRPIRASRLSPRAAMMAVYNLLMLNIVR